MNEVTFDQIQTGKLFQTSSKITYQKISDKEAKVYKDNKGTLQPNGLTTVSFYKTKILLTVVQG